MLKLLLKFHFPHRLAAD